MDRRGDETVGGGVTRASAWVGVPQNTGVTDEGWWPLTGKEPTGVMSSFLPFRELS